MKFFRSLTIAIAIAISMNIDAQTAFIGQHKPALTNDRITPEVLWQMGRIGGFSADYKGEKAVYNVSYYSKELNKSHAVIKVYDFQKKQSTMLTQSSLSESDATFIPSTQKIAFLCSEGGSSQLWTCNTDGSERKQISHESCDVLGYLFSPDAKKVILIKAIPYTGSIQANDADLTKSSGMVINDLMYKHWDHYVKEIPHPFLADFDGNTVIDSFDMLEGEPFECPMEPFGGVEQLAWSPDASLIAYTCRKKTGVEYAISTDSDIFLFDVKTKKTVRNLCKPADYVAPKVAPTRSLEQQAVNRQTGDYNVGYDQNPQFSPDGKYIAWTSMARDGYESDRTRLCVYELATGKKTYLTESFESGVNEFVWTSNSKQLYFTGVWHGKTNLYSTNFKGEVKQLTDDVADYSILSLLPNSKDELLLKRRSMQVPDDVFLFNPTSKRSAITQVTFENKFILDQLALGEVKERWVKTVDGKEELCWVIYPPHFDATKKYPTLLFCEGGPQSPVSQFWSYRWNFQIMAANDYIIIAPNRRGLPGFGMEWLEQISGDYTGLCMQDYLSAIDDIAKEPYVDADNLGAVGASFGGFSIYWLAGNHNKRFKAFIAHDGIFNTQQQYFETEEMWFANWDLKAAPWQGDNAQTLKAYAQSPHLYVEKWDTPILCISGQKDFRIEYTQTQSAFNAARLKGLSAQMLLFPDENHWVLKPQNGILWQRTFFRFLDKYLK